MELTAIAKPYASAIFAIAQRNASHSTWRQILQAGAQLVDNPHLQLFIKTPKIAKADKIAMIKRLLKLIVERELSQNEHAFVRLLLANKRLEIMSNILELFDKLTHTISKTRVFNIVSTHPLNAKETQQMIGVLSAKYNSAVSIDVRVNPNLIGGIVIKEEDTVIDLSIQTRLDELNSHLLATHLF